MTVSQKEFEKFDRDNPKVWESFVAYTFQAISAGRTLIGAKMVTERIRWESFITTKGTPYKINNNFTAFYARKFAETYPQYRNLFRTRESVADRSIALT